MPKVWVVRCPECGSTKAGCDESRSIVDISLMLCLDCGNEEAQDSWQRDFNWRLEIELAEGAEVPDKVAPLPPNERFPQGS